MALINWFPGHMAKALRLMSEEIKNVDMIIYVLDSRAPFSCVNPEFANIAGDKPILYILNKSDLADESKLDYFKKYFSSLNNANCITLNSVQSGANKVIEPLMKKMCQKKLDKFASKGIKIHLRAMVIGVPNSGKSTLINNLCGVKKAITGDKAGVTRGKQWLALKNGFELLDTPGTLWPNFEDQQIAKNLAYIGSIKNEVLDINELALSFIETIKDEYSQNIENRYSIKTKGLTGLEILDDIASAKHFLLRGNEVDYDRTCFAIIDDFRKGRLGKITVDKVN